MVVNEIEPVYPLPGTMPVGSTVIAIGAAVEDAVTCRSECVAN